MCDSITKEDKADLDKYIAFIQKAEKAVENEIKTSVEFTCPNCGGKAIATVCRGHIHAHCDTCNIVVQQ